MSLPHLYADSRDIARIRKNLQEFSWYRQAFSQIQTGCDEMLRRGFSVPETCGFVFYNSCKSDNTPLIFNPYDRENHICPTCGMNYRDEPFQRAWQCYYHQWLAQMSINLGISYAVTGDSSYAQAVRRMLLDYLRFYPGYENNDNELGTTKVFQSTYIESVWLSYLTCGYDLTNQDGCWTEAERTQVKRDLFLESAKVIRDYDEKRNNRQAFNNSGLCAAALTAEDGELLEYALHGPHGFFSHMEGSVLSDGLWYEGDNYHFATVPSMVNIAEMCLHNGIDLYQREYAGHSIRQMFEAPLKSLQPDLSFPSRKDSPYASSIAQRWYSGLYELAYTRYREPAFGRVLKVMYGQEPASGEFKNAAGLMDIFAPSPASRSFLDWRGFLTLAPDLGQEEGLPYTIPVNMEGTGLAVLRKDGCYLSLDYGDYGGGHGHPDRLAISYFARGRRWLTDYGTGQYYFDHLNWYRSTIGHNTLCADGKTQLPVSGSWEIFGETAASAAARGRVNGLYPGIDARRTILLLEEGIAFDCLEAFSEETHCYHAAFHGFGTLELEQELSPAELAGDNYRFLSGVEGCGISGPYCAVFSNGDAKFAVHSAGAANGRIFRASAYGPPNEIPKRFPILIAEQTEKSIAFAQILEDIPENQESRVLSFVSEEGGSYRLTLRDGRFVQICCTDAGLTVCRSDGNEIVGFEIYGTNGIPGVVTFAMEVPAASGWKTGEEWSLELPKSYGRCTLSASVCGGTEQTRLQKALRISRLLTEELFNGIENTVQIQLGNFTESTWAETLTPSDFPEFFGLCDPAAFHLEPGELRTIEIHAVPALPAGQVAAEVPFASTGEVWKFRQAEPLAASEWLDFCAEDGCPLRVLLTNRTSVPLPVRVSFQPEALLLSPGEARTLSLPLDDPSILWEEERVSFSYDLEAGALHTEHKLEKACAIPRWLARQFPLDSCGGQPNLHLLSAGQISRGEKHWGGPQDLSALGLLTVSDGTSLTLSLAVTDDQVLFSGGKFPFDNDGIQLYFDRRPLSHRMAGDTSFGVYGLLVRPGVFDEVASVVPLTKDVAKPEEISVSVRRTQEGYAILLDIPFTSLGGAPQPGAVWGFDLIINDRDRGVRRDMQMIWSGALPGERTYLREDHHNPDRFGIIRF